LFALHELAAAGFCKAAPVAVRRPSGADTVCLLIHTFHHPVLAQTVGRDYDEKQLIRELGLVTCCI
jgi:hypothetical protein